MSGISKQGGRAHAVSFLVEAANIAVQVRS